MSTRNVSEKMERSEPMARVDAGLGVCDEGPILDFHANNFLRVCPFWVPSAVLALDGARGRRLQGGCRAPVVRPCTTLNAIVRKNSLFKRNVDCSHPVQRLSRVPATVPRAFDVFKSLRRPLPIQLFCFLLRAYIIVDVEEPTPLRYNVGLFPLPSSVGALVEICNVADRSENFKRRVCGEPREYAVEAFFVIFLYVADASPRTQRRQYAGAIVLPCSRCVAGEPSLDESRHGFVACARTTLHPFRLLAAVYGTRVLLGLPGPSFSSPSARSLKVTDDLDQHAVLQNSTSPDARSPRRMSASSLSELPPMRAASQPPREMPVLRSSEMASVGHAAPEAPTMQNAAIVSAAESLTLASYGSDIDELACRQQGDLIANFEVTDLDFSATKKFS
ncbi:hypothetical protein B0H13DRAFT_1854989 [Mycena leptocephala]|nr:hypothetical protein B0H13DRAFT_1854989 [Mycena leptocephala]